MFHVMDHDNKGYISLAEYLTYIDVMMFGDEEEKLKQSYRLLDERGKSQIHYEDFNKIVHSFAKMWSAALGTPSKKLSFLITYFSADKPRIRQQYFHSNGKWQDCINS